MMPLFLEEAPASILPEMREKEKDTRERSEN